MTYRIHNIWYSQQYASRRNTRLALPHRLAQWTSVYYLDMSDGCPKTELITPMDQKKKTVKFLDVTEGDVITSSFIVHRAPNPRGQNKNYLSWNSDCDIDPWRSRCSVWITFCLVTLLTTDL